VYTTLNAALILTEAAQPSTVELANRRQSTLCLPVDVSDNERQHFSEQFRSRERATTFIARVHSRYH